MSCFICDLVAPETHKILDAITSYRGIPLYHVLYDFVSKHLDVKINDDDIVCETCCALLDAMDCFRCKLDDVEHMLQLQIARKYKLCDERPICRLDDRAATKYRKGTEKQFACVECAFETDFADCLMPHSWRHEHRADAIKNPIPVKDGSADSNVCRSCHLGFSADELLETHLAEFHTKDVESGSRNVAESIELELVIDAEGDTDDGNYVEDEVNEANESIADDLQCAVSRRTAQHLRTYCQSSAIQSIFRNVWKNSTADVSCNSTYVPFTFSVKFVTRSVAMEPRCWATSDDGTQSTNATNAAKCWAR